MNVLITGAAGFIGGHLVRSLATLHNVFCVTRASPSSPTSLGRPVIANLQNPTFTENLPSNIECVIHLAQSTRYRDFPDGVEDMSRINVDATLKLLEWARKTEVKHFIYTSSANVYSPSTAPCTESSPTQPTSFYGASKLAAENFARQYQKYFQVDVLRCFTVYGPGQTGMLIPNVIERITNRKPLTLAKGVGVYLSPIYVEDVVGLINKLITKPYSKQSRLMNVCGDEERSLGEIVAQLEQIIGTSAIREMTSEDASCFTGNNTSLKHHLGPYQLVDMQTGLAATVRHGQ